MARTKQRRPVAFRPPGGDAAGQASAPPTNRATGSGKNQKRGSEDEGRRIAAPAPERADPPAREEKRVKLAEEEEGGKEAGKGEGKGHYRALRIRASRGSELLQYEEEEAVKVEEDDADDVIVVDDEQDTLSTTSTARSKPRSTGRARGTR